MAKKNKGRRSDYIAYLLLKAILFTLRTLPGGLSKRLCVRIGLLIYKHSKKYREMAVDNLTKAFPEKSEREILDIARKVFENLGLTLFDYTVLPRINKGNYKDYFEYEGTEYVEEAFRAKKGILFLSAHLCCWEMMSVQCYINGKTSVLAKDIHNRHIDRYVKRVRRKKDVLVMPVRHSIGTVMKILRSGGTVHTLLDQHTHMHEGVMVDFFDRPASTAYFAGLLALKLDISIIPVFVERVGDSRYKLCYKKPVAMQNTGDKKKDISDNTQALTKVIEDEVRKRPEDWFWMHNRWKGV